MLAVVAESSGPHMSQGIQGRPGGAVMLNLWGLRFSQIWGISPGPVWWIMMIWYDFKGWFHAGHWCCLGQLWSLRRGLEMPWFWHIYLLQKVMPMYIITLRVTQFTQLQVVPKKTATEAQLNVEPRSRGKTVHTAQSLIASSLHQWRQQHFAIWLCLKIGYPKVYTKMILKYGRLMEPIWNNDDSDQASCLGVTQFSDKTHMETAMGSEVILPKTPQIHHSKGRGMSRLSGRQQVQICASVICSHLQSTTVLQAIPSAIPSPKNTCAGRGCCRGWKLLEVSCSRRSYLSRAKGLGKVHRYILWYSI